jgi:hypothetical protein
MASHWPRPMVSPSSGTEAAATISGATNEMA